MIRMIQSVNSTNTKSYFHDALARGDYYIEDAQELGGVFQGKLAQKLGLEGEINQSDFYRLCENINPVTGKSLTPRTKSNRTVGYDINFHCPKSVSIFNAISSDKRILKLFQNSVTKTMQQMEADMKTRIRKKGQMENRHTGNLIWGQFVHHTARPVDGQVPDPHLHAHCFTLNATYDEKEDNIKAGQFKDIMRDMPYYQALFQKELSDQLNELGYKTRATKNAFELEAVPQEAIDIFSKRSNEIGQIAKEKGITDPAQLDMLGARTRAKKDKGYTMDELRKYWKEQVKHIRTGDSQSSKTDDTKAPQLKNNKTANKCIEYALQHCLERNSVISERSLLATAINHAKTEPDITSNQIHHAYKLYPNIKKAELHGQTLITTEQVYKQECEMVQLAKLGKGRFAPINRKAKSKEFAQLNHQQANAVRQVLCSIDQVNIIRGGAGTGKTTLMKTAQSEIERRGLKMFAFAPSTKAAKDVLVSEGFETAETSQRLLIDKKLQAQLKNQLMWVDEAGLLSTKDMVGILKIAKEQNARLILSGDTRQHSSVERGDALRILKLNANIKVAGVEQIYRQKQEKYKQAVEHISQGDITAGFNNLKDMGAIIEKEATEISDDLAKDYINALNNKKSALVIAPTHAKGDIVTKQIRQALREQKIIKGKDHTYESLRPTNFTQAEKTIPTNYKQGQIVQFHQNLNGIKRGSKLEVSEIKNGEVILHDKDTDNYIPLDLERANHFDIFNKHNIEIGKGDIVRITKNCREPDRRKLNNGTELKVHGFDRKGNIRAVMASKNSKREVFIPKDFGNLTHAYVATSHASQGKTVDKVFIAQPSSTFGAVDKKQFYVSVSRGREEVKIYTDSKSDLLGQVQQSGDRMSAIELHQHKTYTPQKTNEIDKTIQPSKGIDYDL